MRDYIEVIVLICVLKLRWWYFHLCPWYYKCDGGYRVYFQNMRKNTIHTKIIIKFNEDSPFYKADT